MMEIGRLCVKITGRDAGKRCVVVDTMENNLVLIDGETRRRKCNVNHLEPLEKVIKIKKKASHSDIEAEFKKLGLEPRSTKPKPKTERPKKVRKVKPKVTKPKPGTKATPKAAESKAESEKKFVVKAEPPKKAAEKPEAEPKKAAPKKPVKKNG